MKKTFILFTIFFVLNSNTTSADSLSSALGATKLDGLSKYNDCQRESMGYRERLIADRLELKLANTTGISQEERNQWLTEIASLRQNPATHRSQLHLRGLNGPEQTAINSMSNRFTQEINLKCEQKFGGMSRFSPGSSQSAQIAYENKLRAQMNQPVQRIEDVPIEPLPSLVEKSPAQLAQEERARQEASKQVMMQSFNQCADSGKSLRPKLIAEALQRKLDSGPGLSAKQRAELQADIQAAWMSAGKGLNHVEVSDPQKPVERHLSPQENIDISNEYARQYTQIMQNCTPSRAGLRTS